VARGKDKEGNRLKDLYFERFRSLPLWQEQTIKQLHTNRTLVNLFGRKYKFYRRNGPDLWRAGYSYNPQSTVGEITNQAFCGIYNDQVTFKHVSISINEYDGLYFQVPLSITWQEHSRILFGIKRLMEVTLNANGHSFIIPADFTMLPFNFDAKRDRAICEGCKNFDVVLGEECGKCGGHVGHPYAFDLESLTAETLEEIYEHSQHLVKTPHLIF